MSEPEIGKKSRAVKWVLVILPLWLVVSTLFGLWIWTKRDGEVHEPAKFATAIDELSLKAELVKVLERVGPRHTASETGRKGLTRMAAFIEGTLGPDNAGYRIDRVVGPASGEEAWPILLATLPGDDGPPLWVVAAYDQDPAGGGVEANATGVTSVLAVAQALAGDTPDRPITFAFLPHGYDPEAPLGAMIQLFNRKRGEVDRMLVIEAMGGGEEGLLASSRSAAALGHAAIDQGTKVVGAEAICLLDDRDLSSLLFEAGNPTVRVGTRPVVRVDEPDDELPSAGKHSQATEALAALIRGLATTAP